MNTKLFDALGISEMHAKGYKGKGVRILIHESSVTSLHVKKTRETIKLIAPEAVVDLYDEPVVVNPTTTKQKWNKYSKYDIVNRSMEGDNDMSQKPERKKLYDSGTLLFSAAGNSDISISKDIEDPSVLAVEDLVYSLEEDKMVIATGFAPDPNNLRDFFMPSNVKTSYGYYNGSSGATAVMSGIAALMLSAYKQKKIRYTSDDIVEDLKSFARLDVYEGYDISRNGISTAVVTGGLHSPEKLAYGWTCLKGFEPLKRDVEIKVTVNSKTLMVDGMPVKMDAVPVIQNGRFLIPVRFLAEALGLEAKWDGKTRTATIRNTVRRSR